MEYQRIAGVDEVGRGPLVGDVVTAAVILDPDNPIDGLTDSKKLSEQKRIVLAEQIKAHALSWAIGRASPAEIDHLNILHASMLAMQRAVEALPIQPEWVRVDGNRLPQWHYASEAVVKGDAIHAEIGAASILAKVTRDAEMLELHEKHPEFGFDKHKGYPTKAHFAAIEQHGVLDCYRKSFKPVQSILSKLTAGT
ncbi:ribonuclease HII [Alteromonas flava]|uniref:ribonuclease HII n=1 Tax=Alteromonas flava TaxID=2048003 RepID=UPI000C291129|nr:ribonuclease HII [Alteromonas flava]